MTYNDARDAMFGIFYATWDNAYPVMWEDQNATPPATGTPWARVILTNTNAGQSSLAGEVGTRRFSRTGFIAIQIFVPVGNGQTLARQLAQSVSNAYEDARLDVWFRNTRIREQGTSGAFEQIDVLTDFSFDEVR